MDNRLGCKLSQQIISCQRIFLKLSSLLNEDDHYHATPYQIHITYFTVSFINIKNKNALLHKLLSLHHDDDDFNEDDDDGLMTIAIMVASKHLQRV